jgi:hypothetical protein
MTIAPDDITFRPHSAHWGTFLAGWYGDRLIVKPHPTDPDPSPLLQNFPEALRHKARIARPMVRRGWLERGPGADDRRGRDDFVPMAWDRVLDLHGGRAGGDAGPDRPARWRLQLCAGRAGPYRQAIERRAEPGLAARQDGVRDFIPVAHIADMLLNPGRRFDYNGQRLTYPDIRLVYWAGGNPFHHWRRSTCLMRATRCA